MGNKKDLVIKFKIEELLKGAESGSKLKSFFENLSESELSRALFVFSSIYPEKNFVPDDEFDFLFYMMSNSRYIEKNNFSFLIQYLNILKFSNEQKKSLIELIKINIEKMAEKLDFEFDSLLLNLFGKVELFKYVKFLSGLDNIHINRHIYNILKYENFSDAHIEEDKLNYLLNKAFEKMK